MFNRSSLVLVAVVALAGCAPTPGTTPSGSASSSPSTGASAMPSTGATTPAPSTAPAEGAVQVTLTVDGQSYTVDTTKVNVDRSSESSIGYDFGNQLSLGANEARVDVNAKKTATGSPAFAVAVTLPGDKPNSVLTFLTSGAFDDSDNARRTNHGDLSDVHVKATMSALQDSKVSHTFDVTVTNLLMK